MHYTAYFDPDCEILAIYRDRQLIHFGPPRECVDFLLEELEARVIHDNTEFLVGQSLDSVADGSSEPAESIDEIERWLVEKGERLRRADELEARADDLIEEARRLRGWNDD